MASVSLKELREQAKQAEVPDGVYDFRVVSAKVGTSKGNKEQLVLQCEVVSSSPVAGSKVPWFLTVSPESPNAVAMLFRHLAVLGVDSSIVESGATLAQVAPMVSGRYFTATVSHREWNGEQRVNLDQVQPYVGAPPTQGVPQFAQPQAPQAPVPQVPTPGPGLPNPAMAPQVAAPVPPVPGNGTPAQPVMIPAPLPASAPVAPAEDVPF